MKGCQTIRSMHVDVTAKNMLLSFFVSLIVTLVLSCNAYATVSGIQDDTADDVEAKTTELSSESTLEGDMLLADTGAHVSSGSYELPKDEHTPRFAMSVSVKSAQETPDQNDYVSIRGYSAFNHLSLALKATVAAIGVIGVCFVSYCLYRRYKGNKED